MILAQKTIIVNMGDGDLGKSESILMVYEELCELAKIEKDNVKQKDICEIVTINNINVGIASDGDTQESVKGHLDFFKENGCAIILTASRANNPMVKLLKEFADTHHYRLWRTSNARIFEETPHPHLAPRGIQRRFNEQWAEEIANMIESWCYAGKQRNE